MRNNNRRVLVVCIAASCVLAAGIARAGIENDMKSFFNSMGSNTAVEPAKIYKGQSATYGNFGGFASRSPIRNFNPLTVSLPNVSAGCGGIDAFLGGFSHINADAFVQYLQAIGNNAVGFAFQLAMDVISPQLSSVLKDIRNVADWANQLNSNSCQSARLLVKGASAALGIRESYCTSEAVASGKAAGTPQAKYMCQDDEFFKKMNLDNWNNRDKKDRSDPSNAFGNLVWDGLKQAGVTDYQPEFAMAVMNVTGTYIEAPEGVAATPGYKPARLTFDVLLTADETKTFEYYRCVDTDVCLNTEVVNDFKPADLRKQIRATLVSIANKITSTPGSGDTDLDGSELALINMTRVPIYGMLQYAADVSPTMANGMIEEFADHLVTYVLVKYMDAGIKAAYEALGSSRMSAETVAEWRKTLTATINVAHNQARKALDDAEKKIGSNMDLINRYNMYRGMAYNKYAPDMQKRMAFAKMLSKQNRTGTAPAK